MLRDDEEFAGEVNEASGVPAPSRNSRSTAQIDPSTRISSLSAIEPGMYTVETSPFSNTSYVSSQNNAMPVTPNLNSSTSEVRDELRSSMHDVAKHAQQSASTEPPLATKDIMHTTPNPVRAAKGPNLSATLGRRNPEVQTSDDFLKERERQARAASTITTKSGARASYAGSIVSEPNSQPIYGNTDVSGRPSYEDPATSRASERCAGSMIESDTQIKQRARQNGSGVMPGALAVSGQSVASGSMSIPSTAHAQVSSESRTNSMLNEDSQAKQRSRFSDPDTGTGDLQFVTSHLTGGIVPPQTSRTEAMLKEDARSKQRARGSRNPDIGTSDLEVRTTQVRGGIVSPQTSGTASMLQQDAQAKQRARSINPDSGTSDLQAGSARANGGIVPAALQGSTDGGSIASADYEKARERRARRTATSALAASSGASTTPGSRDSIASSTRSIEVSSQFLVPVGAVGVTDTGVVRQRPGVLTHPPSFHSEKQRQESEQMSITSTVPPPPQLSSNSQYQNSESQFNHRSLQIQDQQHAFPAHLPPNPTTQVEAIEVAQDKNSEEKQVLLSKKSMLLMCIVVLVLIGGGIGIGIALGGGNNGGEPSSENDQVDPPEIVDEKETWNIVRRDAAKFHIADSFGLTDIETLEDPASPQFAAWRWLVVEDTKFSTMSQPAEEMTFEAINTLMTRYVLAVMYFSLDGFRWDYVGVQAKSEWLESTLSHCDWAFIDCNRDEEVTGFFTGGGIPNGYRDGNVNMRGSLPLEMRFFTKLKRIRMPGNNIKDISALSASMASESETGLITIDFGGNLNLVDDDPIYRFTNIDTFSLTDIRLRGTLPPEISRITTLLSISIGLNEFTGTISNEFANAPGLKNIFFPGNNFEGDLMNLFSGHESKLEYVDLTGNQFSGTLSPALGNMTIITTLQLNGNSRVSGSLPTEMGLMKKLRELDLTGTSVDGSLPTELGNLVDLEVLDLGATLVSGTIPEEWSSLTKLKQLSLASTFTTGTMPQAICDLPSLVKIFPSNDLDCSSCPKCSAR